MSTPTIDEMIEMARAAGAILREGYGKNHQIDRKGRIDLVTEMDRKSEEYLIGQIRSRHPGHMIQSEESGRLDGQADACWFIDPLDGTTNYAHHTPVFAVSMGFAQAGKLHMGVVYDPLRDECFSAVRGQGAFLNGQSIHVSTIDTLLHSLLVTGFAYDIDFAEKNLVYFAHFHRLTQGVRRFGSAAIDLCSVAAGRIDGYWEQNLQSHDLAAGALIVEEAGGVVTSIHGETDYMKPPFSVLTANPQLHPLMLAEMKKLTHENSLSHP